MPINLERCAANLKVCCSQEVLSRQHSMGANDTEQNLTQRMIVLSTNLSTEQVTLIIRVITQALSYGVPFLLGYLILGNAPRIAPLETHDLLNRIVGQSTSFYSTCRWIIKRSLGENRDPVSSKPLLIVLVLSLWYGAFVSISDFGILGINSCTVAGVGSSFQDFPASIKSDRDALALVTANMMNGTDPSTVQVHRCEASVNVIFNPRLNMTTCSEWSNSTYGNSSHFSILNSTDTDVLMPRGKLAHDSLDSNATIDLNMYFLGASGTLVTQPTIQAGLAVFPYDTGLRLIVGVPQLFENQMVEIPKTFALEVEIGCLPLGVVGQVESNFVTHDYFIPDDIYLSERLKNYTGPEYLQAHLSKAADQVRQAILTPFFDTSSTSSNGYYPSLYPSINPPSPLTDVVSWAPPGTNSSVDQNMTYFYGLFASFVDNCMADIYESVNATKIPHDIITTASLCEFYQIRGSSFRDQSPVLAHSNMVCATTTQLNMVSATLEMDGAGVLTYNFTRLPSTINLVAANYVDGGGPTTVLYDNIWRYTLSDDPDGPLQHYIFQERAVSSTPSFLFTRGSGNIGLALAQVGSAMITYSANDIGSLGVVNPNYFSTNYTTLEVTRWASSLGASYLLSSVGYNGWAARGSPGFTVVNTATTSATCYNLQYAPAFVPLFFGSLAVIIWAFSMLFTSQISKANKLEELYGGLSTVIEFPYPGGLPSYTYLEWDDHPEPHLKPAVEKMDPEYFESRRLVEHMETHGS